MLSLLGCMALKKNHSLSPTASQLSRAFQLGVGAHAPLLPLGWNGLAWSFIALCAQPQLLWVEEYMVLSYPEDTVYICPPTLRTLRTFLDLEPWVEEGYKDVSFVAENNFLLINFLWLEHLIIRYANLLAFVLAKVSSYLKFICRVFVSQCAVSKTIIPIYQLWKVFNLYKK